MKKFKSFFGFAVMMLALATLAAGQGQLPTPFINAAGTARGNLLTMPSSGIFSFNGRSFIRSGAVGQMSVEDNGGTTFNRFDFGPIGNVNTVSHLQKTTSAIADNTLTTVLNVQVTNNNTSCSLRLLFASTNGSTAAFQSTRVAEGWVAITRVTGANAVGAIAAIGNAAIATSAAGATHTLAYSLGAVSGAVGATNTVPIQVTIDDSTNVGGNQLVVIAETLNNAVNGCQTS